MRHLLSPKHHEHLHQVGIENAHDLFIVDVNHEHYERQKESWKRTLPLASEEELHMHALASVLWKTQERGKPKPKVKKYRYHWFLLGIIVLLIALLYFIWPRKAHAQIVEVQGAGKGSTTSNVATVTPVDANHNAVDVNITAGGGTGGGPADAAANAAASESDVARQKVIAVIRLLDTGQAAGSQLVTAKGDQTSGMWVNCKSGCAGGSSTPADTFATPTTAGLTLSFPMLWNGATFDRQYGDKTNGAFVNIKNSVALAVTGTFWQATQPVSGTFFQATQPVSIADAADVTLGAKADAKSTATDVTPVTMMQVMKEISAMEQAPASRAVTNAGTFATQATLSAETTKVIGTVNVAAGQTIAVTNAGTFAVQAAGTLTDNNAAPSSTNVGAMPCMARTDLRAGTAATAGRLIFPDCGTDGLVHVTALPDSSLKRFAASSKFAASSTTDNWRISGNASNTVILTDLSVTCTQTTAGMVSVVVRKESAAVSGGTAATVTNFPVDSNKAGASSVVQSFTGTGPTVGTLVGDLDDSQFGCMASATATPNDIYIYPHAPGAPIAVLRGVAEGVALNFGGAITGGNLTVKANWVEVTTITP